MKNITQVAIISIGLFLLVMLILSGIILFNYAHALYLNLDPQLTHTLTIALLVAVILVWPTSRIVRQVITQRMRREVADDITVTYQYFIDYWSNVLSGSNEPNSDSEVLHTLNRLVTLYADTKVLKVHMAMRTLRQSDPTNRSKLQAQFAKALHAMRGEFGAGNAGINRLQLQELLLGSRATSTVANIPAAAQGAAETGTQS